jgi:hypothetical protein
LQYRKQERVNRRALRGEIVQTLQTHESAMPVTIRPYTEEWTGAVAEFNARMRAGAGDAEELQFPENHVPKWLTKAPGWHLFQEYFLAVEDATVRGVS